MKKFFVIALVISASLGAYAESPLISLDDGEIDTMRSGAKLWSDKDFRADNWHAALEGLPYVRASMESSKAEVAAEGHVLVVTPTYGQRGGFSLEVQLREAGFDPVDLKPFLPFAGAARNGDMCGVYQKKVHPGDVVDLKYKYGITLWAAKPLPLASNAAPHAPEVNLAPGPEYADTVRMFQGIPSLARASNGRLWATFYGGGPGEGYLNYIMLVTSGDDGVTWSRLKLVIDPDRDGPIRASEPGVWVDPDGRLWLMWNQYPIGLDGPESSLWAIVTSNPESEDPIWSKPRLIGYPNVNSYLKPIVLRDGTWLWPSASWYDPTPSRPLLSKDKGKSFEAGGEILIHSAKDRNYQEYCVVELVDGRLWLTTRTSYGIGESFSTDKGKSWTGIAPSKIVHPPARHFMTRLKSGKLLLVKHGAIDERVRQRSRLMAFISEDDGATWSGGLILDERVGVSYPDGVESPDGTIYIIYDFNRHSDKEILMATFTEEDVISKRCVSEKCRLRVLVNKAYGEVAGKN